MFRTLLFATVIGAGVGNAATVPATGLDARSNSPPSYFCSSNTKKCSKQRESVTAYCSSYLAIPKVTKTKTKTVCTTKTATITSVTGTVTSPPQTITSTISSCASPVVTTAAGDSQRRAIEANELEQRGAPVHQPSCFGSYSGRSAIAAACSCYSIQPGTTTITKTISDKKTATRTFGTASTVTGSTVTTWVFPSPTFIVANDQGGFAEEECDSPRPKEVQSGTGRLSFDDDASNAILFALNAGSLAALEGSQGNAYEVVAPEGEDADYSVLIGSPDAGAVTTPLSCSVSQAPDGTCPLKCTVLSDGNDVNQGNGFDSWFLGPPNTVTDLTYKTFAVTRGDPTQRGGRCNNSRGGFRQP